MQFFIYNSITRRKELFKPIHKGKVSMYTCGPTVYDFSHIGNFRTFIFQDLLKRWLIHLGYNVKHIMNITDVDDKTIKKSMQSNLSLKTITENYTSEFMNDIMWLKINPADNYPKATDHIEDMIKMIETLIFKKMAYVGGDGSVYFDISSYKNYGKLSNIIIKQSTKRNFRRLQDEYQVNDPQDFALWKKRKPSDGNIFWNSPWGQGRPGWHIECSAMSIKLLGKHFDIHCGGVDNIFPHHENEIAQSVGSTGEKFVNYWIHSEHLMVDGSKMSKSKSNFYTLNDLKEKGFCPQSIRFQLLSGHYRTKITFSLKKKHESDKIINRISNFYFDLKRFGADKMQGHHLPEAYESFKSCLNNDLDTPGALAVFLKWMKEANKNIDSDLREKWNFMKVFDSVFKFIKQEPEKIETKVKGLLNDREKARDRKDWKKADQLRAKILEHGWIIEDTKDGQKLKKMHR